MVDTIKLLITIPHLSGFDGSRFSPITLEQLVRSRGYGKTYLNPAATYARMGKYMPRLTMYKRVTRLGIAYQLAVEFSAPKMLFGNNFDELQESDFDALLTKLHETLQELLGGGLLKSQLAHADIATWHPSKNIVFNSYTSCQTILNTIGRLDISKIYDLQKTNFRDGHVVHIHANSLDIAFYDKLADLRKTKVSSKRAFEQDGSVQLKMLEKLNRYRPMEVFRYEVRFAGRASIKRAYPELEKWTFESMFKSKLCQSVLLKHWNRITNNVDMLALDAKEPYELLQNYIEDNQEATPQAVLAAVAGLLITSKVGVLGLRNVLEARYGKQAWYRIKPLLRLPGARRFQAFVFIDEELQQFAPASMSDYLKNIENSVK